MLDISDGMLDLMAYKFKKYLGSVSREIQNRRLKMCESCVKKKEMGKLIDQQAVIDCLTNTAKYYDMPQADEWTKGIHYGLLHGIDNILDNVPTVEAIPKDQYEARLKADMVAMLEEISLEIDEMDCTIDHDFEGYYTGHVDCQKLIREKINALKEDTNEHI